jgi:Fe/S biogenesis protein NfuA
MMIRKLEKLFDDKIRPSLRSHGGDIEIVDVDNNKVFVILHGGCQGCSASKLTLSDGVKKSIQEVYPEITDVIDLTDHHAGKNPYQ